MSRFQWVKDSYDKGTDVKTKVEKVLNPVPPQPGLIPVGGDFYATPPTPQPPNYEDPFSDSPIGIDIEIVKDECNLGIQMTGSLFFMKLPSFQFVWRNPGCSPRQEQFELPHPPSQPPASDQYLVLGYIAYGAQCREQNPYRFPYLIDGGFGYNFQSSDIGEESESSSVVQILSTSGRIVSTPFYLRWYGEVIYKVKSRWRVKRFSYKNPGYNFFGVVTLWDERSEAITEGESESIFVTTRDENGWSLGQPLFGSTFPDYTPLDWRIGGGFYYDESADATIEYFDQSRLWSRFREKKIHEARFNNPWWTPDVAAQGSKYKKLGGDGRIFVDHPYSIVNHRSQGTSYIYLIDGFLDMSKIPYPNLSVNFKCKVPKPPPPPPLPMKEECCDELTEMLLLLLKRVGPLPANVPDLLTKKSPQLIRKESLTELILWHYKQLDAVSGKYPLEVKIQDIDPNTKGNQEKTVTLPNQAELLADIYQAVLTSKQVIDALLPVALKTLVETGSIKLTALATHDLAYGNADFLGWDIVHTKDKVKFSFNPVGDPEAPMSELLEPAEVEVKGYENKDKKDFRTWIVPIARMAAAWMAQNFRKVKSPDDLKEILGRSESVVEEHEKSKNEDDDFDVFLNNFQSGFTTESGITDPTKPFGNDYEQRPRVREFGSSENVVD